MIIVGSFEKKEAAEEYCRIKGGEIIDMLTRPTLDVIKSP